MSNGTVNKMTLIGNLGADPEVRQTGGGNPVANLSLATDESYRDQNTGEKVPLTEWHKVVLFGKKAEIAGEYLRRGSKLYVVGKKRTRKWQDQNGQDQYTVEIVVDAQGEMEMLGGRGQGQGQQGQSQGSGASAAPATADAGGDGETWDDDIPF